ncbi:MAG TPA: hypothetical protein PLN39_02635 [Candidatus Dojkabacteria bacterium]|nr:hypothetical protein [Candidatus Dojkabacteria bacterium]
MNVKCSKKVSRYYHHLETRTSDIKFEGSDFVRDDEISEIAVLLAKFMQFRFPSWDNCEAVVAFTLRDWKREAKVSDNCYDNVLLFLNRHWKHAMYLPYRPAAVETK